MSSTASSFSLVLPRQMGLVAVDLVAVTAAIPAATAACWTVWVWCVGLVTVHGTRGKLGIGLKSGQDKSGRPSTSAES